MLQIASKIKNEAVTCHTNAQCVVTRAAQKSGYSFDYFEDSEHADKLWILILVHYEWVGVRDVPAVLSSRGVSKRDFGAATEWMRENSPPDLFSALEWATILSVDKCPKSKSTVIVARERVDG